jgi:multicomponent Na+:H+ antiporter subunit D
LAERLPWVAILFTVGSMSISGMPLFNGFVTKTMTIAGAAEAHHPFLALALEVATAGTFIAVGIRLPYLAFWRRNPSGKTGAGMLKPIPWNMYAAMAVAALLCIAQGVYPEMLYRSLPYVVAHPFEPWTAWHVLQALLLLGFSGLAVVLLPGILTPRAEINLDLDYFYRLIGRGVLALVCRPLAWIDDRWTEVYRSVGLQGLMGIASGSAWFDKQAIDGVVDGSASAVRGVGRIGARVQNGNLQDYLALATTLAVLVFAMVWYFG